MCFTDARDRDEEEGEDEDEYEDEEEEEDEEDVDDSDFPEQLDDEAKDEGWTRFLTMEDVFGPGYDPSASDFELELEETTVAGTAKGPGKRQPPTREERREINSKFKRRRGR